MPVQKGGKARTPGAREIIPVSDDEPTEEAAVAVAGEDGSDTTGSEDEVARG